MIYKCSELKNKLGSFAKINSAVKRGEYFKISYGLYSDRNPYASEPENIIARYPNAIFTLQSAFSYYDMSDYVPDKYYLATFQGAHKIQNKKVKQIYITDKLLNIGKTTIKTDSGIINIYDKERLLIELFRLKNKLSFDYFKEVVNSYRKLFEEDQIDTYKLAVYCAQFNNGDNILRQIQEVAL